MLVALMFMLSSCGYHLRGSGGSFDLQTSKVFIQSSGAPQLTAQLRRQLGFFDITVVPDPQSAEVIIGARNEQNDSTVLSVDPQTGKATEYGLGYQVHVGITRPDGTVLAETRKLTALRDITFDPDAFIGKVEEEQTLRKEMVRDVADRVLRLLDSVD